MSEICIICIDQSRTCISANNRILKFLNKTVDPCEDFYQVSSNRNFIIAVVIKIIFFKDFEELLTFFIKLKQYWNIHSIAWIQITSCFSIITKTPTLSTSTCTIGSPPKNTRLKNKNKSPWQKHSDRIQLHRLSYQDKTDLGKCFLRKKRVKKL